MASDRLRTLLDEILDATKVGRVSFGTGPVPDNYAYVLPGGGVLTLDEDRVGVRLTLLNSVLNPVAQLHEKDDPRLRALMELVKARTGGQDETFANLEVALGVREPPSANFNITFTKEDQELGRRFDFSTPTHVELTVKPDGNTDHWRLGFEFSADFSFSGWRYGVGHPLWHLTKNAGDPRLLVAYYDIAGRAAELKVAIEDYRFDAVQVVLVSTPAMVRVLVGKDDKALPLSDHRIGRLFAWADDKTFAVHASGTIKELR